MARNGRGGVLLKDLPLLTGHGPQLVMVQPKDLLEARRDGNKKRPNRKSKTENPSDRKTTIERPLNAIDISPDFSKFLDRPQTEERSRGGFRDRGNKYTETEDELLSSLAARKPSWNFESILKEFEEDNIMMNSSSSSNTTEPADPFLSPEELIEIPLESQDEHENENVERRRSADAQEALSRLFDQLLSDIYSHNLQPWQTEGPERRSSDSRLPQFYRNHERGLLNRQMSFPGALSEQNAVNRHRRSLPIRSLSGIDRSSFCSLTTIGHSISHHSFAEDPGETVLCENKLKLLPRESIEEMKFELESNIALTGKLLVVELEEKDNLLVEQNGLCEIVTASLQAISTKTSDDAKVKFSLTPATHDQSGFQEWARAMRMVARLPDGVPPHFRKNLWLSLAERHLHTKGVNWAQTERRLFSETTSADDKELSVQIVKDLHRTGCSLFCGVTGQHNQAVLKRVLLAYARWNPIVGYCQGFNMLAALILQVMQGSQSATVKVMIYLIEGVLPESYFGNNLRGLSVDMAVFRDLLRLKLPDLSRHLDHLQQDSKDSGTSYEPPLCDVFTMQWFLTLFSNCLPQNTVLRVWDLVFLEGDQILLRTALAIWQSLSDRMMSVRSADEFYSIMAVLTREMMEFGLMEPNNLIKAIDNMSIPEVGDLREKYIYNISPWAVGTVAKMGVKLLYPDHGSPSHEDSLRDQKDQKMTPFSNHPDREKIALDISALKRQYWKLRERQRQAHIILSANDVSACRSETLTSNSSPALNHLLLGKRALLSAKGRRIEGTVPSVDPRRRQPPASTTARAKEGTTLTWREARRRSRKGAVASSRSPSPSSSSSSSSSTELCDSSDSEDSGNAEKTSDGDKVLTNVSGDAQTDDIKTEISEERSLSSPSPQPPVNDDSRLPSAGSERVSSTVAVDDEDWDQPSIEPVKPRSRSPGSWDGDPSPGFRSPEHAPIRSPELSTATEVAAQSLDDSTSELTRALGSSLSSITRLDSSEMAATLLDSLVDSPKAVKEIRKAPSSSQLGSLEAKWSRPPISSYSSIQLGAAEQSRVTSSSFSSTHLGSVESGSTYSSLSSLPKDDTVSSDWSKKLGDFPVTSDKSQKSGETPPSSPDKSQSTEGKLKRRKSEIALLQILQENSQILQRIHQAHKRASPDEPEDIKEIRRRYGYRQSSSLDSPKTPKSADSVVNPFRRTPSTLSRDVTIKLGLYPDRA